MSTSEESGRSSLTRRAFLSRSALGIAAAAGLRVDLGATGPVRSRVVALRRNVQLFVSEGVPTAGTMAWLTGPEGLIVVDSQLPETAAVFLSRLARSDRVVALIHTHHHRDHSAGNPVLQPRTKHILAHERVPGYLLESAAASWPEAADVRVDQTIAKSWAEQIGDEHVIAEHYGPAHTGGDLVVTFEHANIVHVGDLVYNRLHPNLDLVHGGSMVRWVGVLERLVDDHDADTLYIFSHSRPGFPVTGSRSDVSRQAAYLSSTLEQARTGLTRGWSRREIAQLPTRGFADYIPLSPRLTRSSVLEHAYDELTNPRR